MKKTIIGVLILLVAMASFSTALPSAFQDKQYTYLGKWIPEHNDYGMDYFVPYDDNSVYYMQNIVKCLDDKAKHRYQYCKLY